MPFSISKFLEKHEKEFLKLSTPDWVCVSSFIRRFTEALKTSIERSNIDDGLEILWVFQLPCQCTDSEGVLRGCEVDTNGYPKCLQWTGLVVHIPIPPPFSTRLRIWPVVLLAMCVMTSHYYIPLCYGNLAKVTKCPSLASSILQPCVPMSRTLWIDCTSDRWLEMVWEWCWRDYCYAVTCILVCRKDGSASLMSTKTQTTCPWPKGTV